jgi:formylglycine-generating enzyme required for sulfatase activity
VEVGDAHNPPDTATDCHGPDCGSVPYDYLLSQYEVTKAQYAEFLNAKAVADPFGLYNEFMDLDEEFGGIARSGAPGGYVYTVKPGFEDEPVDYVSFYDAVRFANWLNNGQGSGDTETGAYTITEQGIVDNTITRNAGATVFLPSENEWYKAAYYDPASSSYFDYPTGTDAATECVPPDEDSGNSANCGFAVNALTDVGAYALSESPYGTFDQGGNVREWNEQVVFGSFRSARGGSWIGTGGYLHASNRYYVSTDTEASKLGFRVASVVPEPGRVLLTLIGGLVLLGTSKRRISSLRDGSATRVRRRDTGG